LASHVYAMLLVLTILAGFTTFGTVMLLRL
jgi:hypothetical protein